MPLRDYREGNNMHGVQHKRMGIAAGAGVVAYMILSKSSTELALSAMTIPIGVMLPDVDHDRSKIGRTRKKISETLKIISVLLVLGFVAFSYKAGGMWNALLNAGYVGGMCLIINIIENNKHVKKQLGFITKHRGIMHTLIPPAFIMGTTLWTSNDYYDYMIIGLALGYVVHLLGDMGTEQGAPVLWPLTKVNMRYSYFNTDRHSAAIEMLCNLWCILAMVIGIYFGIKGGL